MWCEKCQAHVAAQASGDNQRLYCTSCGSELKNSTPATGSQSLRDPRELLARWAQEDATDPFGPLGNPPAEHSSRSSRETARSAERKDAVLRFDAPHQSSTVAKDARSKDNAPKETVRVEAGRSAPPRQPPPPVQATVPGLPPGYVIHPAQMLPAPHFQAARLAPPPKPESRLTLVGQLVAYAGVLALTCGAGLILKGYFGGPASYAPMGWLVTTAGQMLLFLGVVTLISCGMEQTTQEVAQRVDSLSDSLLRVERAALWNHTPHRHPELDPETAPAETIEQLRNQVAELTRQLEQR